MRASGACSAIACNLARQPTDQHVNASSCSGLLRSFVAYPAFGGGFAGDTTLRLGCFLAALRTGQQTTAYVFFAVAICSIFRCAVVVHSRDTAAGMSLFFWPG
jgi:hypothetical protein